MSVYDELLDLARRQAEAARTGDLASAAALFDARGRLVAAAPDPSNAEQAVIREVLALDREIASAIRERMLAIRQEVLASRHGRSALAGYRGPVAHSPRVFELQA